MTRPARCVARRCGRRRAHAVTTWLGRCRRKVGDRRRACGTTGPAGSRGGPKIVTRNDPDLAAAAAREGDAVRRRLHHDRAAPIVRQARIPIHVIIIRLMSVAVQPVASGVGRRDHPQTAAPHHTALVCLRRRRDVAATAQAGASSAAVQASAVGASGHRGAMGCWWADPLGLSVRGARAGRIRRESRARGRGFGRRSRVDG